MRKLILLLAISCIFWKCNEEDPGPKIPQNLPIQNKLFRSVVRWTETGNKTSNVQNLEKKATARLMYVQGDSVYTRDVWNMDYNGTTDYYDSLDYDSEWFAFRYEITNEYMVPFLSSPTDTTWYTLQPDRLKIRRRAGWHAKEKIFQCHDAFEDNRYLDEWEN